MLFHTHYPSLSTPETDFRGAYNLPLKVERTKVAGMTLPPCPRWQSHCRKALATLASIPRTRVRQLARVSAA